MNIFSLQFDVFAKKVIDSKEAQETELILSLDGSHYYSVRWCGQEIKFDPPLDITDDAQSLEDAKMKILSAASFDGFKNCDFSL